MIRKVLGLVLGLEKMSEPTSKPTHFAWPTSVSYIYLQTYIHKSGKQPSHLARYVHIVVAGLACWPKRLSESTFYADHEYDFRILLSLKFKILGYFFDFFSYMFNLARTALLIPTSYTDIWWLISRKINVGNKKPTLESEPTSKPTSFPNSVCEHIKVRAYVK